MDKENLFTMDHHPIWYRLAAENKPGQFYYYVPVDDINKGACPLTSNAESDSVQLMLTYNIMIISLRICTAISNQVSRPKGDDWCAFSPTERRMFIAVTAVTVTERKKTALAGGTVSGK